MTRIAQVERIGWVALTWILTVPLPVAPATITVGGGCTLADAISSANSDSPTGGCTAGVGADEVELTSDVLLNVVDNVDDGPNGLPVITSEIVLDGGGFGVAREAGAPEFRILKVGAAGSLVVDDLMVSGGSVSYPDDGGGIHNGGELALVNGSIVSGNFSGGDGGGIFNGFGASSALSHSTVSDNDANDDGGGIYSGRATSTSVSYSRIVDNYADAHGGGIMTYGTLTLLASTVSGNEGGLFGGGISIMYDYELSTITESTLSNNTALLGGGLFNGFGSYMTLTNVTLSGNYASFRGGGLYQEFAGSADLVHTTLSGNGSPTGGGVHVNDGDLTLINSLVGYTALGDDCDGSAPVDGGGNLSGDGTCPGGVLSGMDPSLSDHGGPTKTHALEAGSSAVGAGGGCGLLIDQRGFGRDLACDSGAYELDGASPVVASVGGLDTVAAQCRNPTAGGVVGISGKTTWNCRGEGLAIASGDRVRIQVRGRPAAAAFTGSAHGLADARVVCQNRSTGQSVSFALAGDTSWNCRARGLTFSPGDTLAWSAVGTAD